MVFEFSVGCGVIVFVVCCVCLDVNVVCIEVFFDNCVEFECFGFCVIGEEFFVYCFGFL